MWHQEMTLSPAVWMYIINKRKKDEKRGMKKRREEKKER
jgi:hypothetical protein